MIMYWRLYAETASQGVPKKRCTGNMQLIYTTNLSENNYAQVLFQ